MKRPIQAFNYSIIPHNGFQKKTVDIYIDGFIVDAETQELYKEYFGDTTSVSYKSFRSQIQEQDAEIYNVYINSGGGLVTDAMAMHDYLVELQDKGKTVNTYVRGLAASAATFIAMASKTPAMSSNSWFMIHNVSGVAYGDVNEVENMARTLRQFNDRCSQFYQDRTGLSATVIGNMMDAETWMDAQTAKDKGFITTVSSEAKFTNSIKKENWPYTNMAVLNSYNENVAEPVIPNNLLTQQFDDMKKFFSDLKDSIIAAVTGVQPTKDEATGTIDNTAYSNAIASAIGTAFENAGDRFETDANAHVQAQFNSMVTNLKDNEAFVNAVKTAVTAAITENNLVTKAQLEAVEKDLDKLELQNKGGATSTTDINGKPARKPLGTFEKI